MASHLHLVDTPTGQRTAGFDAPALRFGPFVLHRARKLLLEGEQPVRLSSRAFEILSALVESPGVLVSKDALMARAWPGTVVEEINLRVHIASIRKLLGDAQGGARYITNVSGRGYCFVAPVTPVDARLPASPALATVRRGGPNRALWPMLGRDAELNLLLRQLAQRRLVTIVGPGGIGKTTLAIAAVDALEPGQPDGAYFADLASSRTAADIAASVATAFGATVQGSDPAASLAAVVRSRQLLLCLDNCEHVVDSVAALVETLLAECPALRVLATSREALRVDGEQRHHLGALAMPPLQGVESAAVALGYASVQLFVERATASHGEFQLLDADASAVARLCHRLGGVPLAIELAAARIDQFGVQGLAERLDDQLLLQAPGRRTALPRQRTLRGMLDWSHDLLDEVQRQVLHRLSVFKGSFGLEDAVAVVASGEVDASSAAAAVVALAEKSLLLTERQGQSTQYRVLEVTRAYAAERLTAKAPGDEWYRRHAEYQLQRMARADARWAELGRERWLAAHANAIDDLRAALRWAQEARDDRLLSRLAASGLPLAFQLGLLGECRGWAEQALALGGGASDPAVAMRLLAAMGHIELQTASNPDTARPWFEQALALAEQVPELHRDGIAGMFVTAYGSARYAEAADHARALQAAARSSGDGIAALHARRMLAQATHHLGDHTTAYALAESVLEAQTPGLPMAANSPLQIDRRVSMLIIMGRIDWLQGRSEEASTKVEVCLSLAQADSPFAFCQALGMLAIPVAWWSGDFYTVALHIEQLKEQATRFGSAHWGHWAAHYSAALAELRGGTIAERPGVPPTTKQSDLLVTLVPGLGSGVVLQRVESGSVGWNAAEVLRSDAVHRQAVGDTKGAQAAAAAALGRAARQGELAWELRAATTAVSVGVTGADATLAEVLARCSAVGTQGPDVRNAQAWLR